MRLPIVAQSVTSSQRQSKTQMHPDRPITTVSNDEFGRAPFARRLAEIIKDWHDPSSLVIGLYGVWGEGKTSCLNLMAEVLAKHRDVVIVRFNPWYFDNTGQLIQQFCSSVAQGLGRKIGKKPGQQLIKGMTRLAKIVAPVSFGIPGVSVSPGGMVAAVGEALSGDTQEALEAVKSEIERHLKGAKGRVVVLIDDVDRLDEQETHCLVKLVKLVADFPNTSYVLAFDPTRVAKMLAKRYAEPDDSREGISFLEKIVQVGLHLPTVEPSRLRHFVLSGIFMTLDGNKAKLPEDEVSRIVNVWDRSVGTVLRSVREAKRYLNSVNFAVPLMKGEVHPGDQVLVEALRTFFPMTYDVIRRNPDAVLELARERIYGAGRDSRLDESKKVLEAAVAGLKGDGLEAAKTLIQELYPQTKAVWSNTSVSGSTWEAKWAGEKRAASRYYFSRYFLYAIPADDISDAEVEGVIASANEKRTTVANLVKKLQAIKKSVKARRFVEKMDAATRGKLSAQGAAKLAIAMAESGEGLSNRDGYLFSLGSTLEFWALEVALLIRSKCASAERKKVMVDVIRKVKPLPLGGLILRKLKAESDEFEAIDDVTETELGKLLAARIDEAARGPDFLATYGADVGYLFWLWQKFGLRDTAIDRFRGWFQQDVKHAAEFICTFIDYAVTMGTGMVHRSSLDRNRYNNLVSLFPADELSEILRRAYDTPKSEADFWHTEGKEFPDAGARQFLWMHDAVIKQAERKDTGATDEADRSQAEQATVE